MKRAGITLAIAAVICSVAGPALADRWDHHRGRRRYQRTYRTRYVQPRFYAEPDVYYAPPPVIYTPSYPSPGINFVFPLRIH